MCLAPEFSRKPGEFGDEYHNLAMDRPKFLSYAVPFGLGCYVASKLDEQDYNEGHGVKRPLLSYAVGEAGPVECQLIPMLVKILFDHGADPYCSHRETTPWQVLLSHSAARSENHSKSASWKEIMEIFLRQVDTLAQISKIESMITSLYRIRHDRGEWISPKKTPARLHEVSADGKDKYAFKALPPRELPPNIHFLQSQLKAKADAIHTKIMAYPSACFTPDPSSK